MLEKLKDLLYETSDLLLALVILLIMSSVITWQVTDSLAFSSQNDMIISENDQISDTDTPPSNPELNESDTVDTNNSVIQEEDSTENTPDNNESTEPAAETAVIEPVTPVLITVEIPNGTPGIGIANILKDKGLIDSTATFIARVEELNLAVKLKSGTFNIETGTSVDDIIYIITGKKK